MIDPFVEIFVNHLPDSVSLAVCGRKKIMLVVYIGSLFLAFMMVTTSGEPEYNCLLNC